MKFNSLEKRIVFIVLLVFSAMMNAFSQNDKMELVGGTDFVPKGSEPYLNGLEFIMKGKKGGTLELLDEVKHPGYNDFCNGDYLCVTINPIMLDSLHFVDDYGDWCVVCSGNTGKSNKSILHYKLKGLTPNAKIKLVVNYRSVINPNSRLDCDSATNVQLLIAENPDLYSTTGGVKTKSLKVGEKGVFISETSKSNRNGIYEMYVNVPAGTMGNDCSSFAITSIEVYAEPKEDIYLLDSVCAGEVAHIVPKETYSLATYQWFRDSVAIPGATSEKYIFETSLTEKTYRFYRETTIGDNTFSSNELKFSPEVCCEINGQPSSRKVIFKEDFGEFDFSDKTGSTYKVWDYSDVSNPVQVTKKTSTPFRYELENPPLNCSFNGNDPIQDGEYTVAGLLTGYLPWQGMKGANLEWAAALHGSAYVDDNLSVDHSGKPEGCCLLINCNPNTKGENIYEREISGLCHNRQLFFECYISIFTNSASGPYNPVDVTLRMSEIGNPTNVVEVEATQTLPSEGGTGDWVRISGSIYLEQSDAILLEIVNNANVSENGNDLVLDDITIMTCSEPSLNACFDTHSFATNIVSYNYEKEDIKLFAMPTAQLINYYGGENSVRYLYQWSENPYDRKSWKNIGTPTADTVMSVGQEPFESLSEGDNIYFRVIASSDSLLSSMSENMYNTNDLLGRYSISKTLSCAIKLPSCTQPGDKIQISANKAISTMKGKDVINLCYGESVTLSQKYDITPDKSTWENPDFEGYSIKWFVDEKPGDMRDADVVLNGKVTSETVKYRNKKLGGNETSVVIVAVDALYPNGGCITKDTVFIKYNVSPDAELLNPIAEFEEGDGSGNVDLSLTKGTALDYTIHWWKGQDTLSGISIGDDKSKKFFENLTVENSGIYCYQLVDITTGCAGDVHNYEVKITKDDLSSELHLADDNAIVNVYSASGSLIKFNVKRSEALCGLEDGVYLVGGEKVVVKK